MVTKNSMNAAKLLGLLQTDGHFGFFWDTDKTFRPRVYLTAGEKNVYLLKDIVLPWLNAQGVNGKVEGPRKTKYGQTYNLVVERQTQVKKLLVLLDNAAKAYPTLLVDSKLVQYLALKKAFQLTELKKASPSKHTLCNQQLVDLKIALLEVNAQQTGLDLAEERSKTEERLGVSDSLGKAKGIWSELISEANEKGQQLLDQLERTSENCERCSPELGDFLVGIMDGDGSIQVGFAAHQNSKKLSPNFELVPMFTLTDGYVLTNKHYLLMLFNAFFKNKTKTQAVSSTTKADRIYIKARSALKPGAAFLKNKLVLTKNVKRLEVLEQVLLNYDLIYTDISVTYKLIDLIGEHFEQNRTYSTVDCKRIVRAYFEYKQKGL